MVIAAAAFIIVILHCTGNHAAEGASQDLDYPSWLTRYDEGAPCDVEANCKAGLCCARMTEREGNKCRKRNSTVGQGCSREKWPKNTKYKSYIGGCPCGKGLICKTHGGRRYGTCQEKKKRVS
uniref:Putative secreted protein n=1 Tax=Amblyomma cajennense TaxID=34607 RepID=A0A023FR15_AMBCJ